MTNKMHVLYIVFTIIIIVLCSSVTQAQYTPVAEYSISIPISISRSVKDTRPPYAEDSHTVKSINMGRSARLTPSGNSIMTQSGDTIYLTYPDQQPPWLPGKHEITFIIDTLTNTLREFSLRYDHQYYSLHSNEDEMFYFAFKTLSFTHTDSGTISVLDSGIAARAHFDSCYYSSSDYESYGQTGAYRSTSNTYSSIREDTISYKCFLTLPFYSLTYNGVSHHSQDNVHFFTVSTRLPDHSVYFSFASDYQNQTLIVHNILGREVKRIEIPAGANSYDMTSSQLNSGHYIARLGLAMCSFVVY